MTPSPTTPDPTSFYSADFEFAQDLLEGDAQAWSRFETELKPAILSRLLGKGRPPPTPMRWWVR